MILDGLYLLLQPIELIRHDAYNITSIPQMQASTLPKPLGISELTIQNNSSSFIPQSTLPKKGHQLDNYTGPVDPITRQRHGHGTYRYPNKYFTYEGNYEQGVKQGQGTLVLGDGTVIKGVFVDGELMGDAEILYGDGGEYRGGLRFGEKSGYGRYKSKLYTYEGQYVENRKHGQGMYQTRTTTITGSFQEDKPHGAEILIQRYNYEYRGECRAGLKHGRGSEKSTYLDNNYTYEGEFMEDRFQGHGLYIDNSLGYRYEGLFKYGAPVLYPNCLRVSAGISQGAESQRPQQLAIQGQAPIEYELETESQLWLALECCYQAPEQLDPNQPSEEDIEKMVKDWQAENKKNKNPPPMPDFRQPRMIRPALVVVEQESARPIVIRLSKGEGENAEGLKVDYRAAVTAKRKENELLRAENAKKMEEQTAKKGGKGPKAGEVELKVNCYVEKPSQQQQKLVICNEKGKVEVERLELPDDFPPGNYTLTIEGLFETFGEIKQYKKQLVVKPKNVGGKKK